MTIFDWIHHRLPQARAYAADGVELTGYIFRIDTDSGWYEYYEQDAGRQIYTDENYQIVTGCARATPPIRVVWSRNRFLYRVEMRWHSFMLSVAVFQRTGRWPRRRKVQASRSA